MVELSIEQIWAQIIGIALIIICIIIPHFKQKSTILLGIIIANILWVWQFLLVGAFSGAAIGCITIIRATIFFFYAKRDVRPPLWLLFLFMFATFASVLTTWDGWYCVFLLLAPLRTYAEWQKNTNVLRGLIAVGTLLNGFYCIFTFAFTAALNEWIQCISAIVAYCRYKKQFET